MNDNEITREKTFSEELPYFKERIKEVFDYYDNPNGGEDPLYIAVLRDGYRIVRKAEEEITHQKAEIERLKKEIQITKDAYTMLQTKNEIIKSEAIKEFAERLKEQKKTSTLDSRIYTTEMINNLVKEMIGEE